MGADVYHERRQKSLGALVSLFGKGFLKKYSTVKMHTSQGKEIMNEISQMIMEHIEYIASK